MRFPIFCTLGALALLVGACTNTTTDDEQVDQSESAVTISLGTIVGSVDHDTTWKGSSNGNTNVAVSFQAVAGDKVDIWVRARPYSLLSYNDDPGDAVAWLVTSTGQVITYDDNAGGYPGNAHVTATLPTAGTYYVVLRDKQFRHRPFEVDVDVACATPNTIKSAPCGAGGTKQALCLSGTPNRWSEYSVCAGEIPGACVPGTMILEPCGPCSTRTKTCTTSGTWWMGSCVAPVNACTPGEVATTPAGCLSGVRKRTCSSTCAWGPYSATCGAP